MTDRIDAARASVLAILTRYVPEAYRSHALRKAGEALDEHHNAVVEATLGIQELKPSPGIITLVGGEVPANSTPGNVLVEGTPKFDEVQAAPEPVEKGKRKPK